MDRRPNVNAYAQEVRKLVDEVEQLRTALEVADDENRRLTEDRDRLLRRVSAQTRELQSMQANFAVMEGERDSAGMSAISSAQAEEELRVAFEELQVLTEELEVANNSLHLTNRELDRRVEERTREIGHANAALRRSEASLRTVADLVPDFLWSTDRTGWTNWFNQRWYDYTGQPEDGSHGFGWLEAVHPADRPVTRSSWNMAVTTGTSFAQEHRVKDGYGNYRWFLARAEPLRDERDEVIQWFGAVTDIHDQRVGMEALQRSEARFRTLIEGMPQLVWRAKDGGRWTWSSPQWSEYTGQPQETSLLFGWLRALAPEDRQAARDAWASATPDRPLEIESRIFHAEEQRYRHFRSRAAAVRAEDGRVIEWLGTSTDVDDLHQLQRQQAVLVAELQHRTRNLMGVVQSIVARSIHDSHSLEDFQERIQHRLAALARVQGLLSRRADGTQIAFDTLLREELSAHLPLAGEASGMSVKIEGPEGIRLRSSTVQTLALAIHELATNAVKYGALSARGGALSVSWHVAADAEQGERLCVLWDESGVAGMPDHADAKAGYGRELIEYALPYQLGARTCYALREDGVRCTIEVPFMPDRKGGPKPPAAGPPKGCPA